MGEPDAGGASGKRSDRRKRPGRGDPQGPGAPRDARSEKEQPGRPAKREGKPAAGQSPTPKAAPATQREDSLGDELRAERERGREAARKPAPEKRPDPRRDAPAPTRRRRRWRKGGKR